MSSMSPSRAVRRPSRRRRDWLAASGPMAEAIRQFDWARTPLGTRGSWPHALRIATGMCLNSPTPTLLCWGPDLITLYNDACIPILAGNHPGVLGAPVAEFSPELAPPLGTLLESAATATPGTLPLFLNAARCTAFAVHDQSGAVAGVQCVFPEPAPDPHFQQIAHTLPQIVWIANASGGIEFVNRQFHTCTGAAVAPQSLPGLFQEFAHPEDAPGALQAFHQALLHGSPLQIEIRLRVADQSHRRFLLLSHPYPDAESGPIQHWYGSATDIHDRQAAEEVHSFTSQRLTRVLETDAVGVLFFDHTGTVIEANEVFLKMTGYTRQDVESRQLTWQRMTPPEWVPASLEQMDKLAATGRIGPYEKEYLHKDGSRSWMLFAGRDLGDGTISEYCIDISERKRVEAALGISEQKYRMLFQSIDEGFCIIEVLFDNSGRPYDYRFLETNQAFEKQTGLANPIGRTVLELIPNHESHWFDIYGKVAETGEPVRFVRRAEGLQRSYEVYAFRIDQPHHRRVAVLFNDITDRERLARDLASSEERLQQVFAQAPVAFAVLRGPDLVFELANPAYQQFLPGRTLNGRPLAEVMPEISYDLLTILRGVYETGQPFFGHEYLVPLRRDGAMEDRWFTFTYQPWRRRDNTITGIVVVAIDVSSHVLARRELERANKDLEEFAYVASHDLQEPLRMVNIYSHLLVKRLGAASPEAARYGQFVEQGVLRMETLIKDLLTYSHTVQRDDEAPATADLAAALLEAQKVLRPRIEECAAVILVHQPLPSVRGDTSQLTHVFQNLISNSLKYRQPGIPLRIEISAELHQGEWIVSVQDNGIGFEQQYAERIFGLFKRLHKEQYPGTGLGLAICQRIIQRFRGRIWAESRPGQGATFRFALPVADGAESR
ncbi:MAG: PAS domain S-box protein [Bryobacterales bacterium]|nr:PAS domain S-box protein [Bryobacterales bacterium]